MLTELSAVQASPTAFVMPLLRAAGRTRIRYHHITDPSETGPHDWKLAHHAGMIVVVETQALPELPPMGWAITPRLSAWFHCAHILPVPVSTSDLHDAVNAALEDRRMALVLTTVGMVQPWTTALRAGRQRAVMGAPLGEAA